MFYFFYYLPIGLDVRLRRRVWATPLVMALCVMVYVVGRLQPHLQETLFMRLAFVPAQPDLLGLFASAYAHGGWLHLLVNMLSLGVFGPAIEDRLGSFKFLVLFHVLVALSNLAQSLLAVAILPNTAGYGILGASGAIAGIMGLFLVRLYFARVRIGYWAFLPLQAFTRGGAAHIPVPFALALWFLTQLVLAWVQTQGAAAQIAAGAHLGGLLCGLLLALGLDLQHDARAEAHLERGRRYLDQAAWFPAQGELLSYLKLCPDDTNGHLELARTFRLTQRHDEADAHYRFAAHRHLRDGRFDLLENVYREAQIGQPAFTLVGPEQLQMAQYLDRALNAELAERAFINFACNYPKAKEASFALFRAAQLADTNGVRWRADNIYARLLDRYPASSEAEIAQRELALRPIGRFANPNAKLMAA